MIEGNTDPDTLRKQANKFKPELRRKSLGMSNTVLYSQLIDAMTNCFKIVPSEHTLLKFKAKYIFCDSRMEGIEIDQETAAQIVVDLRLRSRTAYIARKKIKILSR